MKQLLFCLLIFITTHLPVYAETSLWTVESKGSVTYLGGTCHVLRPSDYPLPTEFEHAYANSTLIAFETDLNQLNDPQTLQTMIRNGLYGDGRTLETELSATAYGDLKKYCEKMGVPISVVNGMKPWMALLNLLTLELRKLGVSEKGVDAFFHKRAEADGKMIGMLESVDTHMAFISAMGEGYENAFMRFSLRDLEKTGDIIDQLITVWRKGDAKRLESLFSDQMKRECPDLYDLVLVQRNRHWMDQINQYVRTPEKELVLVGVAHLVGEDGLIALLKKRGYRVEKFLPAK